MIPPIDIKKRVVESRHGARIALLEHIIPAANGRLDVENEVVRSSIRPFPFPNTPEQPYTLPMLAEAPSSE